VREEVARMRKTRMPPLATPTPVPARARNRPTHHEIPPTVVPTGYVYKVRVRTEQPDLVVYSEPRPVVSGMTVQADITTGRRRVIDFFLSPVVKYLDEGMRVR
jgi:multidrug efflux pump subunit AcrA (membrane-fusion protein)